ncbi:amyotrophic lateral sclerosis 2 chromosomal region candidate 11 protein isoform C [Alligator mississippiensis]|uniref:Amyotrophic lateral sclerosis 2 chromosomal region candidate 11 protein isoform C n=1 Tax=Alligator mississippiensis TaxID=8496 RepID=A0A151N9D7_ALLMI|nr:amyotrophic lateral sclerosis 2 chromosomal region candidate 11 protein isoform C [Alligator mississippiensis]
MPDSGAKEGNSGLSAFLTSSVESMQRWARLRGKAQVPRQRQDMQNKIILELVEFQSPKEFPKLLGYATVHLYEVIQVVCTLEVEFTFCYGSFGYGYSHQLKQPEPELQKTIKRSMFLRIPPLNDRRDCQSSVITAQFLGYPAFSSPDLCVADGTVEREISSPGVSSKGLGILQNGLKKIPPRNRLEKMKNEYRTLKTWDKKAEYLDELIMKKGPKMTTGQHMAFHFKEMDEKRQKTSGERSRSFSALSVDSELQGEDLFKTETKLKDYSNLSLRISEQVLKTTEKMHHGGSSEYAESDQKLHPLPAVVITSTSTVSQKSLIRNPEENWERTSSVRFKPMDSEYVIAVVPDWEIELGRKPNTEKLSVLEPTKADLIHLEDYPVIHSQEFASGISERARTSPQVSVTSESVPVIILSDPSGKTVKKLQQFPLKEIEYRQPVLSGDKFEPFLRHIGRTQSTVYERKEAGLEAPIFSVLENKLLCADVKEEEDQDPPIGTPSTKKNHLRVPFQDLGMQRETYLIIQIEKI